MTFITMTTVLLSLRAIALCRAACRGGRAQDAAQVKNGQEVYAAQKCSMCHSIAGKGSKTNPLDGVGAKLSADDIRQWIVNPAEMTAKDEVDEEAADAGRSTAGCRPPTSTRSSPTCRA